MFPHWERNFQGSSFLQHSHSLPVLGATLFKTNPLLAFKSIDFILRIISIFFVEKTLLTIDFIHKYQEITVFYFIICQQLHCKVVLFYFILILNAWQHLGKTNQRNCFPGRSNRLFKSYIFFVFYVLCLYQGFSNYI